MGFGRAVEDRPTPSNVYNWRVYFFAIAASMGSVAFGYDTGVIGGCLALTSFKNEFGLAKASATQRSFLSANIVSTFQAGTFFGALATFPLTEKIGRRWSLLIASLVFSIGSAMQTAAGGHLSLMYAGRAIGGWGVGSASLLVPLYIAEISPPAIRGLLVGIYEIMLQIGALGGFWVNYGVSLHINPKKSAQWQIPLGVQLVPGVLLFIACFLLPETPRFLIEAGNEAKALQNLAYIRDLPEDHEYVQREMKEMKVAHDYEKALTAGHSIWTRFGELLKPGYRNRVAIGMFIMLCQNLTGINAINYYSPTIFKSIGIVGTNTGLFATGVYAVVKTIATILAMIFLIDKLGRRKLLLIGSAGGCFAMFYIASYLAIAKPNADHPVRTPAGTSAIAMIYVFAIFFCISWNGISWIYCSEIFPLRIRSLCVMMTTCTQWLAQFMIARATPYMLANIGYGTYLFFGSCMVFMGVWVFFFVPETKGKTLEQMDEVFGVPPLNDAARAALARFEEERSGDYVHEVNSFENEKGVKTHVEAV